MLRFQIVIPKMQNGKRIMPPKIYKCSAYKTRKINHLYCVHILFISAVISNKKIYSISLPRIHLSILSWKAVFSMAVSNRSHINNKIEIDVSSRRCTHIRGWELSCPINYIIFIARWHIILEVELSNELFGWSNYLE